MKPTIEQLLAMKPQERAAYLLALPPEERKEVGNELHKAQAGTTVQKLVDNLNSNAPK